MTDLTDAEVQRRFAEQLRPLSAAHPHWLWEWTKATAGWLWHTMRAWSPAKGAMAMTGMAWVFFIVLVLLGAWKMAFILTAIYIPMMAILITCAILESERPNGRAGMVTWSNERAGWGPPR
jgi:hypothetical protein